MLMNAMTQSVIRRLGIKQGEALPQDGDIDSEMNPMSIQDDYKALVTQCLQMMGLSVNQICIQVRPVGQRPSGLEVYAAFVKVVRWDESVVKMVSKMPVIEKRLERLIRHSSLPRYSSFAGLWFRSPPELDGPSTRVH
jgi:hypothetical protein